MTPALEKEHLPHIFEPFFTTKEVGSGTGLGLNIAHRIIKTHHGEISVNSTLGQGTEFVVVLPTQQPRIATANT